MLPPQSEGQAQDCRQVWGEPRSFVTPRSYSRCTLPSFLHGALPAVTFHSCTSPSTWPRWSPSTTLSQVGSGSHSHCGGPPASEEAHRGCCCAPVGPDLPVPAPGSSTHTQSPLDRSSLSRLDFPSLGHAHSRCSLKACQAGLSL